MRRPGVAEHQDDGDGAAAAAASDTPFVHMRPAAVSSSLPSLTRPSPALWEWLRHTWHELRDIANPHTLHSEHLTPAELAKQASFESIDYYKAYPDIYVEYLREHNNSYSRSRNSNSNGDQHHGDSNNDNNDGDDAWQRLRRMTTTVLPSDEERSHVAVRWILHVVIAVCVAIVSLTIIGSVEVLEHYRAHTLYRLITSQRFHLVGYLAGYVFWVSFSSVLLAIAAGVVVFCEPAAAGGGIPDVMAYLNGVYMRGAINLRTFAAKALSCVCAVAGGLPVGLEAPLIHLGAITGAGVTQGRSRTLRLRTTWLQSFRTNRERRDFITAGAACGVSAAFGAPIGGLLFAMEELASFWDYRISGQIFLATMICFTTLSIINAVVKERHLLEWMSDTVSILFEVNLIIPLHLVSILPSLVLGALLGAGAALFTKANLLLLRWRRAHLQPHRLRRFLEPILLGVLYNTLMYILTALAECRSLKTASDDEAAQVHIWGTEVAARLFNATCTRDQTYSPFGTLNMATGKNSIRHLFSRQTIGEFPIYYLALYFVIYSVFACLASGAAVSGGLVVPSLVIGAAAGRLYGLVLYYLCAANVHVERGYRDADAWLDPGVFALIGAGAFLAGTSRMTMAVCVIMIELSSEIHYLLPIMVAIVMSKTVADWLSEPLYHHMLRQACVPYLQSDIQRSQFEQLTAAEVMASPLVTLRARERTATVLAALRDTTHHAFPVLERCSSEEEEEEEEEEEKTSEGDEDITRTSHDAKAVDTKGQRHVQRRRQSSSLSRRRKPRYKFAGLVTREDLLVYFALPQLRQRSTAQDALENNINNDINDESYAEHIGTQEEEADVDGSGKDLPASVRAVNAMSWDEWRSYKAGLFLHTTDREKSLQLLASSYAFFPPPTRASPRCAYIEQRPPADLAAQSERDDIVRRLLRELPAVVDLSRIVNRSPWVIPPFFNCKMAYHTFRLMGLRHMVVVDGDRALGIITRNDLLVDSLQRRLHEVQARIRAEHRTLPVLPPPPTRGRVSQRATPPPQPPQIQRQVVPDTTGTTRTTATAALPDLFVASQTASHIA